VTSAASTEFLKEPLLEWEHAGSLIDEIDYDTWAYTSIKRTAPRSWTIIFRRRQPQAIPHPPNAMVQILKDASIVTMTLIDKDTMAVMATI